MKYRCRCSRESCRMRYTFDVHPHHPDFDAVCTRCGYTKFRVDVYRENKKGAENKLCHCDGVHTRKGRPIKPHRWGCERCVNRAEAVINASLRGVKTKEDYSWLTE